MAVNDNPMFSFTNRDYESLRKEGISQIPAMSKGDWSDTNSTDPGVIILDHLYALVDMLQFYMDHQALESYITTAKERKNIFRLAAQLGYKISCAKGAQVNVQFSTTKSYDSTYTIPKNTILSTGGSEKIPFLTTEDLVMYPGIVKGEVTCVQGVYVEVPYEGTGASSLDGSANAEDQYVTLTDIGIDYDTIEIWDDRGYSWSQVDNVYMSSEGSREYSTELTSDGQVIIHFGNGERGYAPGSSDVLTIAYIYSLGSEGKVAAGSIVSIDRTEPLLTESGDTVSDLTVTNAEASFGGTNPEDSELIRKLAPAVIKTQGRAVTLSDYESLAKKVPGVKDAKAYDIKTSPESCLYYEVKVLVLPESFEDESLDILKSTVYNYLEDKVIPPIVLTVITPATRSIDIKANIVSDGTYTDDYIKYEISKNISDYFSSLTDTIGGLISSSTLISLMSKVSGVLYIDSIEPSETIQLEDVEVPVLGNIDITVTRRGS